MKKRIILILIIVISLIMTSCTTEASIKEPEQTNGELNLFSRKVLGRPIYGFEYAIEEFKRLYPDVAVNLELSTEESGKETQQELATKIMSGNAPDVLLLDDSFMNITDIYKLMNNNYFTDLNPYLEADSDYKKEEYHQGVIKGGNVDGKQYIMPLSYGVPVIIYDKNLIEDKKINIDNKNFESFFEGLANINEKDKSIQLINEWNTSSDLHIFDDYSSFSGIKNFDYKNKTVAFNEEADKSIANMTHNLFGNFSNNMYSLDYLTKIKSKELLFISFLNTVDPMLSFAQCAIIKGFSEPDFKFIKDVNDEMVGSVKLATGVYNGSKNKQNAYNFIKILMGDRIQFDTQIFLNIVTSGGGFPTKNTKVKGIYKYSENIGKYPLPRKPLDQEFYDRFYEESQKITDAVFMTPWDAKYYEIMLPYFKGEKTYEECFDLVKAQAKIYINE